MISRVNSPSKGSQTGVVAVRPVSRVPMLNVGDAIAVRVAKHLTDNVMRLVGGGAGGGGFQLDVEGQEMLPLGSRATLSVERGPDGPRYQVSAAPQNAAQGGAPLPASGEAAALARIASLAAALAARQDGLSPLYAGLSATLAAAPAGAAGAMLPPAVTSALAGLLGFRLDPTAGREGRLDGAALKGALEGLTGRGAAGGPGTGLDDALVELLSVLKGAAGGREAPARQATPPPLPAISRHPRGEKPARASGELISALLARDGEEAAAILAAKTEAALARLRLASLASRGLLADGEGAGEAALFDRVLDLPLVVGGQTAVISLQIGRDDTPGHEGEGAHPAWRLRFALDTEATGAVEALVGLDGPRLFASLWAARPDIAADLNERLSRLAATLAEQGLEVVELKVTGGLPDDPPAPSGQFVDVVS